MFTRSYVGELLLSMVVGAFLYWLIVELFA